MTQLDPAMPKILLLIADYLSDSDSEHIPLMFAHHHQLRPISIDWLENWQSIFATPCLFSVTRPRTRDAILSELVSVFTLLKDMPRYRRPLVESVFNFWTKMISEKSSGDDGAIFWRIIGEEANLRIVEDDIPDLFTPTF